MNWDLSDLESLLQHVWRTLSNACADHNNPFRHASLATNRGEGGAVRAVVLRRVSQAQRCLACYTDYRTPKVIQIARCPTVEWLFVDPTARVQIRAKGIAVIIHGEATARAAWLDLPLPSRMLYCSELPPGTEIETPQMAWPGFVLERTPTVDAVESGAEDFAIIQTTVDQIDFLQLNWTLQRRAIYEWGQDRFVGRWVVP